MLKSLRLLLAALILAPAAHAAGPSLMQRANSPECRRWVDSVYNSLTERQRVAQLFCPKIDPRKGSVSRSVIRRYIAENHMGGILFCEGTLEDYVEMTNYAQSVANVPVLMTLDGEWGLSMRVPHTPRFPRNMALGAIHDSKLLYDYGREVARECRLTGLHVNFAPVLDVNSNPANPVIGHRAYGEDPARVSALGVAYSRGLEDGGVQAVGKHFPGHGDTDLDSHKALAVVNHSRATLNDVDLRPFRDYINAGLSGIMVGHLSVPALDPSGKASSLSSIVTTDLLRKEMGFKGLIYTDAMGMRGADMKTNNCVAALLAGADVVESSASPVADLDAVCAAVKSGKISRALIEDRCKGVLAYKYALGLDRRPAPINIKGLEQRVNSQSAEAVNRALCAAAITVVRNDASILPIGKLASNSIAVVNIGGSDDVFSRFCRKYAAVDVYNASEAIPASTLAKIKSHSVIILAVYSDKAGARSAFSQFKGVKGTVPVFFVNPYKMGKFSPDAVHWPTLVMAYDDTPLLREYAAQALFGGIEVTGRMPVNVKGIAKVGDGVSLRKVRLGYSSPLLHGYTDSLLVVTDSLVQMGIREKAFPGAQVMVVKDGDVIIDRAYGHTDYVSNIPVDENTLFDLASVSKTVGTLPAVMALYDDNAFRLDDRVSKYIPGMDIEGKADITVRQLLYHESGMPPSLNMFYTMVDTASYSGKLIVNKRDAAHNMKIQNGAWGNDNARLRTDILSDRPTDRFPVTIGSGIYGGQVTYDTIMSRIYNIAPRSDRRYCYSCLNFCLLMDMEQHITGRPHPDFLTERVYGPIGADIICYRPLERFEAKRIAPTEKDNFLRRQTMHGYVHDELADFSGGVQGNAGVFSNAGDIAKLCQTWLNGGVYGDARIFSEATNRLFTTDKSPRSRRGLGFDKPDTKNLSNSPVCDSAPASVFGHTGFTGTCFWVDPDNQLIYIFLCNRVNPSRDNSAFSKLSIRSRIMEELYK